MRIALIITYLFFILCQEQTVAQCNLMADAGPDQSICSPGGQVQLDGSVTESILFSFWSPPTGLSDPAILDPTADVSTTTSYILTAFAVNPTAPNLIQNPDFEAGNTGFTSNYAYGDPTDNNSLFPEAVYTVVNSPAAVHPNFAACVDHTSGTGQMMVINGAEMINVNIWCQTITVLPGTYYDLGAWISSVVSSAPAELQFSINGLLVGEIFNASSTTCVWEEFDAIWFSETSTTIDFCITNQNTAQSGNDFAIDDISFTALCQAQDLVTITVQPNALIYIDTVLCPGEFIDLGGQIFDEAGSYFDISVIDNFGCEQLYDLNLEYLSFTVINIMNPDITCIDDTVTLSINAYPSSGILFYDWSTIDGHIISDPNNYFIDVDQPGLYELVLTADIGSDFCDTTIFIDVIAIISDPTADAGPDGVLDCTNTSYMVDGSGSDQGPDFSYEWFNSSNMVVSVGLNPTFSIPGNYILQVTDATTGCISSDTVNISVNGALPTANAGPDGVINCSLSPFMMDGSGSSQGIPFVYEWRDGSGTIVSDILNPTFSMAGVFSLTVIDTFSGCMNIDTALISLSLDIPQVDAGPDIILPCDANDYLIDPTIIPQPDLRVQWATPDGNIVSIADLENALVDQSGTYIVTVTNTVTACINTDTVFVSFSQGLPDVSLNIPDTITCQDEMVDVIANYSGDPSTVDFTWTTVNGNFNITDDSTIVALDSGLYIITVSESVHNCSTADTVRVYLDQNLPTADAGTDDILNCNDTLQLDGTLSSQGSDYVHQWTTTNGNIINGSQTLIPMINQAGLYVLIVTDITNGCTSSDTVDIRSNETLPEAVIAQPDILTCTQTELTLFASSPNATGNIVFEWSTSNGVIVGPINLDSIVVNQPGMYVVRVRHETTNCTNSASVEVLQDIANPVIDAGPDQTISCEQSTVTLMGQQLSPSSITVQWDHVNGSIVSGAQTFNPVVNLPGTYYMTATQISNGCTAVDSAQVLVNQDVPLAIIEEPGLIDCRNVDLVLDATASSQGPSFSASWGRSSGNITDISNIYMPILNTGGSYILEITNTDNGCTALDTVIVIEDMAPPIPVVTHNDLNCIDTLTVIDASQSTGDHEISFLWSSANIPPDQINMPVITSNQAGIYELLITDIINGCTATEQVAVDNNLDVSGFNISLPALYETGIGGEVQLNADINFDPQLISSIIWSDTSTLKNVQSLSPTACPSVDRDYLLNLIINDRCEISARTRIHLTTSEIFIPNVFTPNGDGTNDGFTIYADDDVEQIDKMIIVNRWGDIVFNRGSFLPNIPLLGWDGQFRNEDQDNGVFVYFVEVRFINGEVRSYQGDVTLLK